MKKYAFGVDIGGTTIKIGLFETSGNLIEKWEIPTRTQENGTYILNDIAEAIAAKLAEKNISEKEIEGIGVGVPGPVGDDGTVYKCVNLGWSVFNVAIELERKTGFKVKVGNSAKCSGTRRDVARRRQGLQKPCNGNTRHRRWRRCYH